MLADNRDVIADILTGLGHKVWADSDVDDDGAWGRSERLLDGAALLREACELDATLPADEVDELEKLRAFAEGVDAVLDRVSVEGKKEHPATKLNAIREAIKPLLCLCCQRVHL